MTAPTTPRSPSTKKGPAKYYPSTPPEFVSFEGLCGCDGDRGSLKSAREKTLPAKSSSAPLNPSTISVVVFCRVGLQLMVRPITRALTASIPPSYAAENPSWPTDWSSVVK